MTLMTVWTSEPCPKHRLIGEGEIDADLIRVLTELRTEVSSWAAPDIPDGGFWMLDRFVRLLDTKLAEAI